MKDLEEIKKILKKHIPELKEKFGVKKIGIFGSFVRDEQKDTSDIDILIEFEETPSFIEFIKLERYLSEIFGVKVDLLTKDAISPYIFKYIENEVVII